MTPLLPLLSQPHLGVFEEADEIEAYQEVRGATTGPLAEAVGHLLEGVGPLTAGAPGHQRFKVGRVPGDRGIEPGIIGGAHVDHRPHLGVGLAEHLPRTRLGARDPLYAALLTRRPFDGTVVVES